MSWGEESWVKYNNQTKWHHTSIMIKHHFRCCNFSSNKLLPSQISLPTLSNHLMREKKKKHSPLKNNCSLYKCCGKLRVNGQGVGWMILITIHCWQMKTSISGVARFVINITQPRQIWWLFVYSSTNKPAEMEQMLLTCTQRRRQTLLYLLGIPWEEKEIKHSDKTHLSS